jgi:hypothetical protein
MALNDSNNMLIAISQSEFYGKSLLGTALLPYLQSLSLEQVTTTATYEGYSVWGIVLHILYHKHVTIRLLQGDHSVGPFPYEQADWPSIPPYPDRDKWKQVLTYLQTIHNTYISTLQTFPIEQLNEVLPPWQCTIGDVIRKITCHDLYHVAQIRNMGIKNLPK